MYFFETKNSCFFSLINFFLMLLLSGTRLPPADGDGPGSVGPIGSMDSLSPVSGRSSGSGIRRGPGRPRLKPNGPGHQSFRSSGHHHKKVQRPLQVPIRSQPVIKPSLSSSTTSSTSSHTATQSSAVQRPFSFYTQTPPRGAL